MNDRKEYQRLYYLANREKLLAAKRAWRAANREKLLAAARAWQAANPEKVRAAKRAWQAANPEKVRANDLAYKYGLTAEAFDAMKAAQQNRCAICGTESDKLCVDHDHATNKVRALLCGPCNLGLGQFKDSEATLLAAVEYRRKYRLTSAPLRDSRPGRAWYVEYRRKYRLTPEPTGLY